jgi:amino acid adenylation domain-containing protein
MPLMMNKTIRRTDVLSASEKRALLEKLVRDRARPADLRSLPVHRLFEAQASKTPNSIATSFEGETLTYDALNCRANHLAHHLRTLGVGPEALVGLCVDRGFDMMVGLLGVLKAGGAYVPLDPGFPASRLAFMLGDAGAPVLVTQSHLGEGLDGEGAVEVLLDTFESTLAVPNDANPTAGATASNTAYVIYTSGSTGTPKGVLIPHSALTNFLLSMRKQPGIKPTDVLAAVTTLSFDIAALELFLPLTVGAQIEIVPRDLASDGVRLAGLLDQAGATILQATPATWRLLLDAGWEGNPALTALCGGEALTRDLAERLLPRTASLWNMYGPTETTIWSTVAKVEHGEGPVSIGKPIAATRVLVLDERQRPVPVGLVGELHLGGAGLARGYHERPELTAERFVPDPFANEPGARLYRTGDLARLKPDGTLECLGRVDSQVKVRGFRIELGDVEAALFAHPEVRAAAAVAREDLSGENRLIGYLVASSTPPSEADLRSFLRDRVPEYMVPSAFMILEALPLTPNGKVDRKALPDPEPTAAGPASSARYIPPRGPVEEELAAMCAEVLGRDRIGVLDNFFDLGGHSLLAAQLLARVRETFGVELSLRALFDGPTIAAMAREVEHTLRAHAGHDVPPLEPADRGATAPASFAQQRLWLIDQLDPGAPTYNMPTVVRLAGALDVDILHRAFEELARRHETLRTSFASDSGVPVQVIAPRVTIDLPVEDLCPVPTPRREAEALRRAREESWRPFDLATAPLFRARLYRLAIDDHLLVVTTHHIVSDAWSTGLLVRDTAALYEAFAANKRSPLPELPVQYADYAIWQRQWLVGEGDGLERRLAYWRESLAGVPVLELPTDRPRLASLGGRGAHESRLLPQSLSDSLRGLGKSEGATLYMTLLAGFEVILHRYTGQTDFAVGTPVAGRTSSRTEDLIGLFVNTLAIRADLSAAPSFRELLRRVKATTLAAMAHQDVPFDQVVNAVGAERDRTRPPIFQVAFVLQNAPMPAVESPGMTMTGVEIPSVVSKFEMTLSAYEGRDGLVAALEYATDLFDDTTAARLLGHYETLLESACAEPDRPVARLPMLTEEEQETLLQWNGDGTPDDADVLEDPSVIGEDELDVLFDGR